MSNVVNVNPDTERDSEQKSFSFNSFHSHVKLVGGFANVNHDTEWDSIEKKVFFIQLFL
jgi:hypothetical protein